MKSSKQLSEYPNWFVAMWDQLGLETLINVGDLHKESVWAELKGDPGPRLPNLDMMIMRAKANHHRHYEIYAFQTEADVTQEMILDMFKHSPQAIVNLIRGSGQKIYSDREEQSRIVIT